MLYFGKRITNFKEVAIVSQEGSRKRFSQEVLASTRQGESLMRYVILKAKSFLQSIQRPLPAVLIGVALFVLAAIAGAGQLPPWPSCASGYNAKAPCLGNCKSCDGGQAECLQCCDAVCDQYGYNSQQYKDCAICCYPGNHC